MRTFEQMERQGCRFRYRLEDNPLVPFVVVNADELGQLVPGVFAAGERIQVLVEFPGTEVATRGRVSIQYPEPPRSE